MRPLRSLLLRTSRCFPARTRNGTGTVYAATSCTLAAVPATNQDARVLFAKELLSQARTADSTLVKEPNQQCVDNVLRSMRLPTTSPVTETARWSQLLHGHSRLLGASFTAPMRQHGRLQVPTEGWAVTQFLRGIGVRWTTAPQQQQAPDPQQPLVRRENRNPCKPLIVSRPVNQMSHYLQLHASHKTTWPSMQGSTTQPRC